MQLTIHQLSKTYSNGVKALDNLQIEINSGMFGLLGPNGAGKSSLMRTLATLQIPDTGQIVFDGIDILADPMSLRKVLGYLPQEFGVYPGMSAEYLLDYFSLLKGITDSKSRKKLVNQVLELTNLSEVRNKNVDSFSGGMKQRFGIAQILLNNPKLIIVDEPTAGLDPAERNRFLNVLREIAITNIIIFSTHIVEDINGICNELAIMNGGKILRQVKPAEVPELLKGKVWTREVPVNHFELFEKTYSVLSSSYLQNGLIGVRVYGDQLDEAGFSPAQPGLEDFYFQTLLNDR
ncbi:MAG: ABC transporter ATP-binding protein [Saprospiraceae bacterium]|nr:ABC transporter ATP-binding protein [Saprospiraceae bacterium]